MTYRPAFVTQRDGSALASSNCRAAAVSMGLDYHTLGEDRSTATHMRSLMDDQSGGTDSGDASQAWARGWDRDLRIMDGHTFDDVLADLDAGRLVHLDVWHASVGGPCLSGSGAYGHTIAVLPDHDGSGWAVGDPWCTDGYHRVSQTKLKAGADEWGRRVYGAARAEPDYPTGGRPTDPAVLAIVRRIVKRLMDARYPGVELPPADPAPPDTGGPQPILYTTTKAQTEDDMHERPLYATGGVLRSFPVGTETWDYPGGNVIGEIADPTVVYRCVAQDQSDPTRPASWYLIDGGSEASRMRWVYVGSGG